MTKRYRPLRPLEAPSALDGGSNASSRISLANSLPRRVSVPVACNGCRRKKTRCDGQRPCRRCVITGRVCQYNERERNEMIGLQAKTDRLDQVVTGLPNGPICPSSRRPSASPRSESDKSKQGHSKEGEKDAKDGLSLLQQRGGQVELSHSVTPPADSKYFERSRRLRTVTLKACARCRRKRAKCDGQMPCERCKRQNNVDCVYETAARRSKTELNAEVDRLRQRQSNIEQLPTAIMSPKHWEQALTCIRNGKDGDGPGAEQVLPKSLSQSIQTESNLGATSWKLGGQGTEQPSSTRQSDDHHLDHKTDGSQSSHEKEHVLPLNETGLWMSENWTRVTADSELARHLLALYFCWEYPSFSPVSKEHFLQDYNDGRHRYCSAMLVNALLALGCHHSHRAVVGDNRSNHHSSGDNFFAESRRLFARETTPHSLTTIQALGIMSTREARCSRILESRHYAEQGMRLAIEMGLHIVHDTTPKDELAVVSKTFWGTFALNQMWSLMTGTLPQCPYSLRLPPKPAIIADVEHSPWLPYADGDAHLPPHVQLSNVRSVYQCFCALSELVHESLYLLYTPGRLLTAAELLQNYRQYLAWYDEMPDLLRLGHNSTPAVLFTHLYYHFAVLLLFRPYIRLRVIGSDISPAGLCSQAADAIYSLALSYSKLHTLRRTPSLVPYIILASTTTHLDIDAAFIHADSTRIAVDRSTTTRQRANEALEHGIATLTEMAPYHHVAKQGLLILQYRSREWHYESSPDKGPAGEGKGVKTATNIETPLSALFWLQDEATLSHWQDLRHAGFALV